MAMAEPKPKSIGETLLSIPKWALFVILFACTAIPHFLTVTVPNKPSDSSAALYKNLMDLPEGSTVIIQSDWTNSTRGESRGQFDALLRILMRKNVKFALMSVADPQAPEVARNVINDINKERAAKRQKVYKRWEDWVNLGYFPNAEGTGQQMVQNLRDWLSGKEDTNASGQKEKVTNSPVLSNIKQIGDISSFIVVTGTKSIIIAVERMAGKVQMLGMVTGVMGPETLNYYNPSQLQGLSAGLKGVFDLEMMMEHGLNVPGEEKNQVPSIDGTADAFAGEMNMDKGTKYIFTLHIAIGLLITMVVIGNVGVFLTKKKGGAQ